MWGGGAGAVFRGLRHAAGIKSVNGGGEVYNNYNNNNIKGAGIHIRRV